MKIVNICLAGPYNIGWGYQDNLITKYQQKLKNEVTIITSRFVNEKNGEGYVEVDEGVIYEGDVKVIRLNHFIHERLTYYFRKYTNLYKTLCDEHPDFIFIHGCQFIDIYLVCRYLKNNPGIYVCVDNHADYTNSAKTKFAKLVHKTLWRLTANAIDKYASIFYGVIPIRCDFLQDMYGISEKKIDLLVMGADDEKVNEAINHRKEIRKSLNVKDDDIVIITGGKIDLHKKGILNLIKVYNRLNRGDVKLLIFGSVVPELEKEFNSLIGKSSYLGWIDQDCIYDYLCASDLAIFPGRHSVIWEQSVGCGLPSVFLKLDRTDHVNINGNCLFLENDSEEEIQEKIYFLLNNEENLKEMKKNAMIAAKKFSYSEIAEYSIKKTIDMKSCNMNDY